MQELRQVARGERGVWFDSGEGVHIFPAEAHLHFWRVLLEAPPGCPFEGGVFALSVVLPHDYPARPPRVAFETPVYHCNVSDSGAVCLDLLQAKWSAALTVPMVLEAVRLLLHTPSPEDALRQYIAELTISHRASGGDDTRYPDQAREHTRRDAAKSVAEWRREWGCDGADAVTDDAPLVQVVTGSAPTMEAALPAAAVVSRHDIAGIWVTFFQECQQHRCCCG